MVSLPSSVFFSFLFLCFAVTLFFHPFYVLRSLYLLNEDGASTACCFQIQVASSPLVMMKMIVCSLTYQCTKHWLPINSIRWNKYNLVSQFIIVLIAFLINLKLLNLCNYIPAKTLIQPQIYTFFLPCPWS